MDGESVEEHQEKNLDGNFESDKEKDNNDFKADPVAEGKKPPIYEIKR